MDLKTGIGYSTLQDGYDAGCEATQIALSQMSGEQPDIALVFCTIGYTQEDFLEGVAASLGNIPVIGGTWQGIISQNLWNENIFCSSVTLLKSNDIRFIPFCIKGALEDANGSGRRLGEMLKDNTGKSQLLFLFGDFRIDMTAFMLGFESVHPFVPTVGGLTGDNLAFEKCFQFHDANVETGAVSGFLMSGDFGFTTFVSHGSEPRGKTARVTKAVDNIVYELDERPALEVMTEMFGEPITKDNLVNVVLCMGMGVPLDREAPSFHSPYLLRALLSLLLDEKAFVLPTQLREGETFQAMRRDHKKIVESMKATAEQVKAELPGRPRLALQFECGGRGKVMFPEQNLNQLTGIQELFGSDLPWIGALTFGELSPLGGCNYLHNYTGTMVLIHD